MKHIKEASGELVVAGGDGAVDLEMSDHALDAVAIKIVAREKPMKRRFGAGFLGIVKYSNSQGFGGAGGKSLRFARRPT